MPKYWTMRDATTQRAQYQYATDDFFVKFVACIYWLCQIVSCLFAKANIWQDVFDLTQQGLLKYVLIHNNGRHIHDLCLGWRRVTILYDAELARECLVSDVVRGKMYHRLSEFFGMGIFTGRNRALWQTQRLAILNLFSKKWWTETRLQSMTKTMFQYLDCRLRIGHEIELQNLLSQMGLIGFCQAVFEVDVSDSSHEIILPLQQALTYVNTAFQPFNIPFDAKRRNFESNRRLIRDWMQQLVLRIRATSMSKCPEPVRDLLTNCDLEQVVDFVQAIVLGGHETTSRLMTAAIYHVALDQSLTQALRCDVARCRDISAVIKIPIVRQIIQEATRLYPPVWIVAREAIQDLVLGGVGYPRGHEFLIPTLCYLRNEKIWGPDAETFRPERFRNMDTVQSAAYYPFLVGPVACPGKLFAEIEAGIVITHLFRDYDVKILTQDIEPYVAGTLRLTSELKVLIFKQQI